VISEILLNEPGKNPEEQINLYKSKPPKNAGYWRKFGTHKMSFLPQNKYWCARNSTTDLFPILKTNNIWTRYLVSMVAESQ